MSQLVRVSGDYGIKVDDGSSITLDTGNFAGKVLITGDLVVQGGSTSIETTELKVTDKIIYLNATEVVAGNEPSGILGDGKAGIDIYRGILSNAKLLFDENIPWYNPLTDTTDSGSWIFIDDNERLQPLRVAALSSSALTDFVIDLRNSTNVLRLANSDDQAYSNRINNDLDSASNIIPNVRTLRDFVTSGNVTPGMADVDKIYFSTDSGQTVLSKVQANQSSIEFYISEGLLAQLTPGALDLHIDLNIRGSNLDTSASIFNLVNTNAETVNFAGAATAITIGSINGSTTTVRHNLNISNDVAIGGGDLTASTGTFNLINTNVTLVNFAGAANNVNIGNVNGTTRINHNLVVGGGELAVERPIFNLVNQNATTVNFAGAANYIEIGAAFGFTKLNHSLVITSNLDVGGDITTEQTTFNLLNTTASTVNFAGEATEINIGTEAGSTTINDINITGNVISSVSADDLLFDGVLALSNQVSVPASQAGYVKMYSTNTPGSGGTGLYFVNTVGTNDELISKTKAFLFSLIL